jgi:hypothetical protein
MHTCNPSTCKAEAGGSHIRTRPCLKTMKERKREKKEKETVMTCENYMKVKFQHP